jgi:serine/threonine protein kinase
MSVRCPKCQSSNPETATFCADCGTKLISANGREVTATLETPKEELGRGTIFAKRYEIIEELGKGGMGRVYRAFDKQLEEEIAIKLLKSEIAADKKTLNRFKNEIKLARKIIHKNVCRMHDLHEDGDTKFITMEFVPGEDLKSQLRRMGKVPVEKAVFIAHQIADGLAEAHRLGVIHRDLKPHNVMIDKEGNARIMDFGIARSLGGRELTGEGVIIGTPEYMSPEQVEGKEADQRSDIYSLGITLYEMVTGGPPFEGDTTLSTALKHKTEIPQDPREFNPQIPEELSRLILKCMAKEKERRYQRVDEIQSALFAIESGTPTTGIAAAKVPDTKKISEAEWKKSIAVLPFSNLSPEKEQEYFCDGLSEEIINALSHIRELRVAARTSAFAFKGKDIDIREVGEKLKVDVVLEGSVRKFGPRLRITAQLVNVEDGYHIWSGQFDREMKDIFDIQEEISLTIVDHLKLKMLKGEKEKILKRHTEDHEAYELYLKGLYFWKRRYERGLQKSLQYFQLAVEKDPDYALPHVGIADAYGILGVYGFLPPNQAYPRARAAANKALEIDPQLAEVYPSLGWIAMWYDRDWTAAENHFLKAIQMKPDYPEAHMWYGNLLFSTERFDEAVREMKKAAELEPLEPAPQTHVAWALYFARRFDESIEELNKVIASDPEFSLPYMWLSMNMLAKKSWGEAIAAIQKFAELSGESVLALSILGLAYGLAGMKDDAFKILERMDGLTKDHYVGPLYRGFVLIGLGEKDRALENLEKAYLENESAMAYLKVWPILDSLRSNPRFKALLKKMKLE